MNRWSVQFLKKMDGMVILQLKKKPKITKKKETKTKISKNKSTFEQLKEIKKLLDEGLITETEFKKLKKEIFN